MVGLIPAPAAFGGRVVRLTCADQADAARSGHRAFGRHYGPYQETKQYIASSYLLEPGANASSQAAAHPYLPSVRNSVNSRSAP
jgi:hypothetical protein